MQKIGLAAAFVLAVVVPAWATEVSEDITLTEDTTYSGLTGTGTITGAAGDVPIILTIATDEDCTFDGSLAGNLKVVKTGSGLQTFTKANSFTGGLRIEGGYVSVSAANQLGSGGLFLAGGGQGRRQGRLQPDVQRLRRRCDNRGEGYGQVPRCLGVLARRRGLGLGHSFGHRARGRDNRVDRGLHDPQ